MAIPETGKSNVTSTAAIDGAISRHWPKRLARAAGVSFETARFWIWKGMPDSRRQEIAAVILAECDRLEVIVQETRMRWEGVANEAAGTTPGGAAGQARPQTDRVGEPMTDR